MQKKDSVARTKIRLLHPHFCFPKNDFNSSLELFDLNVIIHASNAIIYSRKCKQHYVERTAVRFKITNTSKVPINRSQSDNAHKCNVISAPPQMGT